MGNWFAGNDTPYNKSNTLLGVGLGLLSGKTAQDQVGQAASNFANERQMGRTYNKTIKFLQAANPELAQAVESGSLSPKDAYGLYYQQKLQAEKPKGIMNIGGAGYNQDTGQWITPPAGVGGEQETFYGNPIPIQTPQGIQYGQIGSRGSFKPIEIGQGNTFAPPVKAVDTGTGTNFVGPGGIQVGSPIQKDIAGAASQKEIGEAQGKSIAAAPGDLQAGENAIAILEQVKNNPYKARGTGMSSILNNIPGTGGYDFSNLVDQAKSGAFLTAIQQMRGLGSLSNAEGGAATAAVTRMNTATSEEAFNAALNDYEKIIRQGMSRAQARMSQGGNASVPIQRSGPAPTSSGVQWSIEP
jgi:hypothetical protein